MEWLDLTISQCALGTVKLPGSKSISNRVLLLAALAQGETLVQNLLVSDDTRHMLDALKMLGISITQIDTVDYQIQGSGGKFPNQEAKLFLGNAGTAFRPLLAVLAIMGGHYYLSGVSRMHERPIGDLVDALKQLHAKIQYLGNPGYPPLEIKLAEIRNTPVTIKGNVSSQFLSGLLIALPLIKEATSIIVDGELISKSYVSLTLAQMEKFGVHAINENWQRFILPGLQTYQSPGKIYVEGDASSASYFLAAGAIGGGPVRVVGVDKDSAQGEIKFAEALERMGAKITYGENWVESAAISCNPTTRYLSAIDLDCNHIPDTAMTLAVLALFAEGTTKLRNIASWRVKETDRIAAMATELRKLGASVEDGQDYLAITPPKSITPNVLIDTYDDHRIAMCFSLVSFAVPVRINNPECVAKTFPDYFQRFTAIAHPPIGSN